MAAEEGKKAPAFTLAGIDNKGKEIKCKLSELAGKNIILYFYPRDNTPGCTTQACDFTENYSRLTKKGYTVIGVSPDSVESHLKFREKQGLNITLLSDPDKKIAEKYGAYGEKNMYGKKTFGIIRSTYIIDEKGKVTKLWRNVKATGHIDKVLDQIESGHES